MNENLLNKTREMRRIETKLKTNKNKPLLREQMIGTSVMLLLSK